MRGDMAFVIPGNETLTVEFKSDRKRLPDTELVEAVVCLANAEGGELWLGVEDDGTPTGLHPDHLLLGGPGRHGGGAHVAFGQRQCVGC